MKTIRRIVLSLIPFLLVAAVLLLQPERKQASLAPVGRAPAGTSVHILWHDGITEPVEPADGYFLTVRNEAVPVER